jgi:hypothetical protein
VSRHQKEGQSRCVMIVGKFLNNVTQFIYLGTTATNENTSYEEYESILNSENACHHSVQNIFPFRFLFNNLEINILYNVGGTRSVLNPIVHVTPLKTPFGLVIPLFTIPIRRHYNHNYLLRGCVFT